ncbi:DEAD/DEAH box helicase [Luteimicrobium subarcticum]|uniref:Superfamily II DNA/RNA helicase n=1 Tax=Luteimicrobium subarcticum TaxID=620910 RepID=A0A2M8WSF4_9MICO|nr:DEAD/DEAH box helicase [Luteimicrobium subarcticum]PJI93859.1 superfamily II DNA/RNA helicase [Luteimicrobium subarcticum]
MTSRFTDFALPAVVLRALADQGIESPFPIQSATLPDTLAGRDVLGRGRTGSGKTLAFSLPVVTRLAEPGRDGRPVRRQPRRPRALVLCPTRELANQIAATLEPLASALGLRTTTVFGGVAQSRQVTALDAGVDVLVACPGRLEDLLKQGLLTLDGVEITVLDEADHMADLGFLPGVKRIMDRTPAKGQRLLFSATLDNGVDQLVRRYLHEPQSHSVDSAESPVAAMTHHVLLVSDAGAKKQLVHDLASGTGRRVLFMRTKHQAKKLAKQLTADGVPAVDLHGNLGQGARERNLEAFSSGAVKVLVATDIAARGIHVDEVELVVHVDPPAEHKAYLHRSGRTARAGSGGDVVTLVLPEQTGDVRTLLRQAKITAQPRKVVVGDAGVEALVGERAAYVTPTAPAPVQQQGKKGGAGRQGSRGAQGDGARDASAPAGGGSGRRRGGRGRGAAGTGSQSGQQSSQQSQRSGRPAGQSGRPARAGEGASRGNGGSGAGTLAARSGGAPRRGGRGRVQRGAGSPTVYSTSSPQR